MPQGTVMLLNSSMLNFAYIASGHGDQCRNMLCGISVNLTETSNCRVKLRQVVLVNSASMPHSMLHRHHSFTPFSVEHRLGGYT